MNGNEEPGLRRFLNRSDAIRTDRNGVFGGRHIQIQQNTVVDFGFGAQTRGDWPSAIGIRIARPGGLARTGRSALQNHAASRFDNASKTFSELAELRHNHSLPVVAQKTLPTSSTAYRAATAREPSSSIDVTKLG